VLKQKAGGEQCAVLIAAVSDVRACKLYSLSTVTYNAQNTVDRLLIGLGMY